MALHFGRRFTRVLELPAKRSVLLLGPRQTGKSTLIASVLPPGAWSVDLLRADEFLKYSKDPALFRRAVEERARRGVRTVFVDEVQRVPALLDEIHGLIERSKVRFLLTGSSARKLKRGGGRLFEQWVVLECRRLADYARSEARLFFWRTNTGSEVDLLVEKHGRILAAIEIKTSRRIVGSDLAGLL